MIMNAKQYGGLSFWAACRVLPWALPVLLGLYATVARADGDFAWAGSMGSTSYDYGRSVAVDSAGNVYTTGYFWATADFDPGPDTFNLSAVNYFDIYVSKLDKDGNFVWARSMGGPSYNYGLSIALDDADNVYITGYFFGTVDFDPGPDTYHLSSAGAQDIFVSKLDTDGNFVWARAMGGMNNDSGWAIAVDGAGNVYTTGRFAGTADFDPGPDTFLLSSAGAYDIFVSKLDTDGNFVWARSMGGTSNEVGRAIAVDDAGNVYITGYFADTVDFDPGPDTFHLSSAGAQDLFVSKLDKDGNLVWVHSIGGPGNESGSGIAVDHAGNVYTIGRFTDTVDFDPGPNTFNLGSADSPSNFVSKLDSNGNFLWALAIGATSSYGSEGIALDRWGNVYITGSFRGSVDFNPGPGAFWLSASGIEDAFVSKLDTDGNFVWARSAGGTFRVHSFGIAVDSATNVYTTGAFQGTVDFDPGPDTYYLTSVGNWGIFVSKLSGSPDTTPPHAIAITPLVTGPSNAPALNFSVVFDEPVRQFDQAADLIISHSGTASTGAAITGGPAVYNVSIEGISGDGAFTLAVNTSSGIEDFAGNPLASSVISELVHIDNTPPSISLEGISPRVAQPGDVVHIAFSVDEELLGDPVVHVGGSLAVLAPLETVKSLGHSYAWLAPATPPVGRIIGRNLIVGIGYTNPEPWPFGPRTLEITATDLAGNTTTHVDTESIALVSGLPLGRWSVALLILAFIALVYRRTTPTQVKPSPHSP